MDMNNRAMVEAAILAEYNELKRILAVHGMFEETMKLQEMRQLVEAIRLSRQEAEAANLEKVLRTKKRFSVPEGFPPPPRSFSDNTFRRSVHPPNRNALSVSLSDNPDIPSTSFASRQLYLQDTRVVLPIPPPLPMPRPPAQVLAPAPPTTPNVASTFSSPDAPAYLYFVEADVHRSSDWSPLQPRSQQDAQQQFPEYSQVHDGFARSQQDAQQQFPEPFVPPRMPLNSPIWQLRYPDGPLGKVPTRRVQLPVASEVDQVQPFPDESDNSLMPPFPEEPQQLFQLLSLQATPQLEEKNQIAQTPVKFVGSSPQILKQKQMAQLPPQLLEQKQMAQSQPKLVQKQKQMAQSQLQLVEQQQMTQSLPQLVKQQQIAESPKQLVEQNQIAQALPQLVEQNQIAQALPQLVERNQIAQASPQLVKQHQMAQPLQQQQLQEAEERHESRRCQHHHLHNNHQHITHNHPNHQLHAHQQHQRRRRQQLLGHLDQQIDTFQRFLNGNV